MSPGDIAKGVGDILDTPYAVDFDWINTASNVIDHVFSIIFGFAALFIVVFMTVITTLDVVYITIPLVREKIREKGWDGSNDTKRFRLISSDARVAYEECAIEAGKMPIMIYLKKRFKTYVLCTIILVIILGFSQTMIAGIRGIVIKILRGFAA